MKHLYFIILSLSLLASCQSDDLFEESTYIEQPPMTRNTQEVSPPPVYATTQNPGLVGIDAPLADIEAYTVANMRDAFMDLFWRRPINPSDGRIANVASELLKISAYDINYTHYYISVSPENLAQLFELENDTTLFLSPVPFDRKLTGAGTLPQKAASFDPQTGETTLNDEIKTRYAIVPMNRNLPAGSKILNYLYIPQLTDRTLAQAANATAVSATLADLLVDQAMYKCGAKTIDELLHEKVWNPSGRIQAFETQYREFIGLSNVKVHAFNCTEHGTALTDKDGYFTISRKFKGPVNYYIEWGTDNYFISDDALEPAYYYCGRDFNGPLYLKIKDGPMENIATLTRALTAHFSEDNNWGRVSEYGNKKLEIRYRHQVTENDADAAFVFHETGKEFIYIYGLKKIGLGETRPYTQDLLLYNMFHELGHAAMYYAFLDEGKKFFETKLSILESWAQFVGWFMLNREIESLHGKRYDMYVVEKDEKGITHYFNNVNAYNLQGFNRKLYLNTSHPEYQTYLPLFIDFIDDSNQNLMFKLIDLNASSYTHQNDVYPDDDIVVSNYALLKNIAYSSPTLDALKSNMLRNASALGTTVADLDKYFEFYTLK